MFFMSSFFLPVSLFILCHRFSTFSYVIVYPRFVIVFFCHRFLMSPFILFFLCHCFFLFFTVFFLFFTVYPLLSYVIFYPHFIIVTFILTLSLSPFFLSVSPFILCMPNLLGSVSLRQNSIC